MKIHDTAIIGGGISGLACARTLADNNKEFVLISKDLGGRMLTSKSFTADYGASYITSEYNHVLKYIDKGESLSLGKLSFIQNATFSHFFSLKNILLLPKMLMARHLVKDYVERFAKFRERSLIVGQKKAIIEDKVLERYTKMPATDFIKQHKLDYLNETFFRPVLTSTAFADVSQVNTFFYLGVLAPMVCNAYEADFRHTIARLTKGFKKRIILDEVKSLKRMRNKRYAIKTKKGVFYANNVVIAVPYAFAKKIYPIKKTGTVISMYVLHVIGKREEIYDQKKVVFFSPEHHEITILWKQHTGSDIIFTKIPNPDLRKYYEHYHVVKKIYWKNALMLSGSSDKWLGQKLGDNLYLASDYNICGLEDAFITGLYAANQIIKSTKKNKH